jgi:hypothetical protein
MALRATRPAPHEVEAWCRPGGGAARQACLKELKALFASGASDPSLLWWLREEERVLARLLLLREEEGLAVGRLDLPWTGAWRGCLRRLLQALRHDLAGTGAVFVELGSELLPPEAPPAAALEPELGALGFLPQGGRRHLVLRRRVMARPVTGPPPAGAALDGDAAFWQPARSPTGLAAGLELLAAHGARLVTLEWPVAEADPGPLPAGWQVEEDRVLRSWRWRLAQAGEGGGG